MRKLTSTLLGLGAMTAAHAIPVTFSDLVNPNDFLMVKGGLTENFVFSHSILDNGFNPANDLILDAQLSLSLADDNDQPAENVRVSLDNVVIGSSMQVTSSNFTFLVSTQMLQTDGLLEVKLKTLAGDFWFRQSELVVNADRPEAVPEPGTYALMGLGLLGLGAAYRRRK